MSLNVPSWPMNEDIPPLRGEFDDVCPKDCLCPPEAFARAGSEDELDHIAVLGYN